jgi:hypothetical protein
LEKGFSTHLPEPLSVSLQKRLRDSPPASSKNQQLSRTASVGTKATDIGAGRGLTF